MKHSDKDIEAAERHRAYTNHFSSKDDFLAGLEHKQKDVDELVEALQNMTEQFGIIADARNEIEQEQAMNKANELIQKHKR